MRALCGLILAIPSWAAAEDDWGDDDAGWGEDDDVGFGDAPPPEIPKRPPPTSVGGTLRTDEAVWMERLGEEPVAKARQSVDLWLRYRKGDLRAEVAGHAELDAIRVYDRDRYDPATYDAYAWQVVPREMFVGVARGPFELTAGRQIVAWGEGNVLSPVDVVNPRDLREPGLVDLDDLRLPVTMLRIGWFAGSHRLEGMAVPEADFGYRSPPAGPYGALPALVEDPAVATLLADKELSWAHVQPRWDLAQTQGFLRWSWRGQGLDAALYAASVLDRQGVIGMPDTLTFLTEPALEITLDHRRYTLLGHSGAAPLGPLLARWEAAAELGRAFDTGDVEALPPVIEPEAHTLLTGMVGLQWTGLPETTVEIELTKGWMPERPDDLLFPADAAVWAVRVSRTAFRERLRVDGLALVQGFDARYGGLGRISASWTLADGWQATLGAITYQPGRERGMLLGLDTHDRVYAQVRFDF